MRVLFWAPIGIADGQYSGFGRNMQQFFSGPWAESLTVTLACSGQVRIKQHSFSQICSVSRASPLQPLGLLQFLSNARTWLRMHAHEFDLFLGTPALHHTVLPAHWANELGLPALIRIATAHLELGDKAGLKGILGLPRRRRKLLQGLAGIIALSQEIIEEAKAAGVPSERIYHVPNGVDLERFHPVSSKVRSALRNHHGFDDIPTILFVGEITERKRPDFLIDVLALLRDRHLKVHLVLVGPERGKYAKIVRKKVAYHMLDDWITFAGLQQDPARFYQMADIFVLPSTEEGMPNALLEAAATGIPAVVCPFSGSREVVENRGSGMIIAPELTLWGRALSELLIGPEKAEEMGRCARANTVRMFDVNVRSKQLISIFERVSSVSGIHLDIGYPDPRNGSRMLF